MNYFKDKDGVYWRKDRNGYMSVYSSNSKSWFQPMGICTYSEIHIHYNLVPCEEWEFLVEYCL